MASGLIWSDDGQDITMDTLSAAVDEMGDDDGPHQCEFIIFAARREPPEPEERCDSDAIPGEPYCPAHYPWTE